MFNRLRLGLCIGMPCVCVFEKGTLSRSCKYSLCVVSTSVSLNGLADKGNMVSPETSCVIPCVIEALECKMVSLGKELACQRGSPGEGRDLNGNSAVIDKRLRPKAC